MLDQLDAGRAVILRSTTYTATATFVDENGGAVDPGAVTVTVTRDDGTELVSDQSAGGAGVDARTVELDPGHTARLDRLTASWRSATLGTVTTQIEIVGGFVCGIGQIDAILDQRSDSLRREATAEMRRAARTVATDAIERVCNQAFTPRYARDRFDGVSGDLFLPTPTVLAVQSIGHCGDTIDLADVEVTSVGSLYRPSGWRGGRRSYDITWEHGWPAPPADVSRAVALLSVYLMTDGPWDDRGYGVIEEGGFARLLTAGVSGAAFSLPEVQAVVARYRQPVIA